MIRLADKISHTQNTQHTFVHTCTCGDRQWVTGAPKTRRKGHIKHFNEGVDGWRREGEQKRSWSRSRAFMGDAKLMLSVTGGKQRHSGGEKQVLSVPFWAWTGTRKILWKGVHTGMTDSTKMGEGGFTKTILRGQFNNTKTNILARHHNVWLRAKPQEKNKQQTHTTTYVYGRREYKITAERTN